MEGDDVDYSGDLNGYKVLPIRFEGQDAARYVYFKEHTVRREDALCPKGRTLFVLNPPLRQEDVLEQLFSAAGPVQSVRINSITKKDGSKGVTGNVVYKKAKSMKRALTMNVEEATKNGESTGKTLSVDGSVLGMKKWMAGYWAGRPDAAELKKAVDSAVSHFDDEVSKQKAEQIMMAQQESDQGWTLVTGNKPLVGSGADSAPKRRKKKELVNFYRHQQLEAQKDRLAQLRRRFDEDSERMEMMRGARKFRPY